MAQVEACFRRQFVAKLQQAVKAEVRRSKADPGTGTVEVSSAAAGEDDDEPPAGGAAVAAPKRARKSEKEAEDENEEDNEEYQEGKLRFTGTWMA